MGIHRSSIFAMTLVFVGFGCGTSPPPIAGGQPVEHWLEVSKDVDSKVRVEAVKKLGNIGAKSADAMSAVFDALSDPSPAVRKEAIYAVVRNRQASKKAVSLLEEMKEDDTDMEIRKIAEEAYQNLTTGK